MTIRRLRWEGLWVCWRMWRCGHGRERAVTEMLQELTPRLDERQRRLMAGAGARTLGRGGIAAVARATGLSRTTIRKGAIELERGPVAAEDRVRRPGAGRRRA